MQRTRTDAWIFKEALGALVILQTKFKALKNDFEDQK